MPTCSANCASATVNAGTEVIFKGGDTWTGTSNLPISVTATGTATTPVYYGVDRTWYTGSSWTQPALDEGTDPGTGAGPAYFSGSGNYREIDGFHLTGWYNNNVTYSNPFSLISSATDESITNVTLDGWSHDSCASSSSSAFCDNWWLTWASGGQSILVQGDTVDDSANGAACAANLNGNSCSGGAVYFTTPTALIYDRNTCFDVANCIESGDGLTATNNLLYNVGNSYDDVGGKGQHCNTIEDLGNTVIANNIVHDVALGCFAVEFEPSNGSTVYLFNNVVWNTGGKYPMYGYPGTTGTIDAWNNTVVGYTNGSSTVACFITGGGTTTLENNHCVSTSLVSGTATSNTNLTQTWATATSAGYTVANEFSPTSTSSPTVGTGTNLTSDCTGALANVCTSYEGHPRPSSAAWDIGAYQYSGGSGSGGGSGPITGDLNNDGTVNIFDLSILLSHWQQSGTGITGDLNNDGTVNIFDLSILLGQWGE
jgi:hypothetical protein